MAEVSVQLRPDVAKALQGQGPVSAEARDVELAGEELGVRLVPTHPRAEDLTLVRHFRVLVEDDQDAVRVAAALREHAGVEAAFVKPPAELP